MVAEQLILEEPSDGHYPQGRRVQGKQNGNIRRGELDKEEGIYIYIYVACVCPVVSKAMISQFVHR